MILKSSNKSQTCSVIYWLLVLAVFELMEAEAWAQYELVEAKAADAVLQFFVVARVRLR